jgi:hypothetical protein
MLARVSFDCAQCGKTCSVRLKRFKEGPKFCSQKCNSASRKGTGLGTRPNHRVVCERCGTERDVYRAPSAIAPRFCSLTCLGAAQRGENNPSFTGGRHVLSIGYVVILAPEDPEADPRGYIYEHRFVARSVVGRMLLPGEVVHHIDGDKANNAPENLMVFPSQSAHLKHHAEQERSA